MLLPFHCKLTAINLLDLRSTAVPNSHGTMRGGAAAEATAELNRSLRQRFAADPTSLSPDELSRATVLAERDRRKLKQAAAATAEGS